MKIKAIALGIAATGLLGSCKSSESAYNSAKQAQYQQIMQDRDVINQYGYSTLKPNGNLSSIEGNEVLHFLTKNDSIAYAHANKLANGLVRKAIVENQKEMGNISNSYIKSKAAIDAYYSNAIKNSSDVSHSLDLSINYQKSIQSLKQNNEILPNATRREFKKDLKDAYKESARIRKYARKALGVVAHKLP